MKFSLLLLLWFSVAASPSTETAIKEEGTQEASFIKFTIKNMGLTVEGIFESFTTTVDYNKSQPSSSRFSATIQVASIDTGIGKRDSHLKKQEYFHVEKYPTISFQSTSVSAKGPGQLSVKGNITIKGKTQPIELQVGVTEAGGKTQFSIKGQLDRLDFGVGGDSWVMSDEVYLNLYIEN